MHNIGGQLSYISKRPGDQLQEHLEEPGYSSFSPYVDPATNKDVIKVTVTLEIMERRTSLP